MHSLRSRLIVAFIIATLMPLGATIWITMTLLDRSLGYATTEEIDRLSRTLEGTVRQFYQRERDSLRRDALAGALTPASYRAADQNVWPEDVRAFWDSGESERSSLSGPGGDHLDFMRKGPGGVDVYR